MREHGDRVGDRDDHDDGFLVDGVAPPVIGGAEQTAHGGPVGDQPAPGHSGYDPDPPTSPIPAGRPSRARGSWLGRLFRGSGRG